MTKLSLVIPFIDNFDITKHCLEKVNEFSTTDPEIWLIDNGSEKTYFDDILEVLHKSQGGKFSNVHIKRNEKNVGVLATFKQGCELASGDIICFIHNDVLIQEDAWDDKVIKAFEADPKLGLAGLFGAVGVGDNGGRVRSQSKILGQEWGKCECHQFAWQHHSEYLDGVSPATILDAVGMFFSKEALGALTETDMYDDFRPPNHFHDRIMPLKLIDKGYRIASIGIGFDHYSGATANHSESYKTLCKEWLDSHPEVAQTGSPDQDVYNESERLFFKEFGKRIPCTVDSNWDYHWTGIA